MTHSMSVQAKRLQVKWSINRRPVWTRPVHPTQQSSAACLGWIHAGNCLLMIITQNIFVLESLNKMLYKKWPGAVGDQSCECLGHSSLVSLHRGVLHSSHCFTLLLLFAVCPKQLELGNVVCSLLGSEEAFQWN